jgi:hypothetical protein
MHGAILSNKITGPNARGLSRFPIRTSLATGVGQFYRSAASDTSGLSPCPQCLCGYSFSPLRHRGHREFCGWIPAGRGFSFRVFRVVGG